MLFTQLSIVRPVVQEDKITLQLLSVREDLTWQARLAVACQVTYLRVACHYTAWIAEGRNFLRLLPRPRLHPMRGAAFPRRAVQGLTYSSAQYSLHLSRNVRGKLLSAEPLILKMTKNLIYYFYKYEYIYFFKFIFLSISFIMMRKERNVCKLFLQIPCVDYLFTVLVYRYTLFKGSAEVSCWSDWQNDDRHLGGARGVGSHATTRDCRRVRIRRGKLEFETFRTLTYQGISWYGTISMFFSQSLHHLHLITIIFYVLRLLFFL